MQNFRIFHHPTTAWSGVIIKYYYIIYVAGGFEKDLVQELFHRPKHIKLKIWKEELGGIKKSILFGCKY